MNTISLSNEEVDIVLKSLNHCLNTCEDSGAAANCPDCAKVQGIMTKMRARV